MVKFLAWTSLLRQFGIQCDVWNSENQKAQKILLVDDYVTQVGE